MDCIDILKKSFGKDLNDAELISLMERVKQERRRLKFEGVENVGAELEAALKQGADRLRVEEIAKKRAAMLDYHRMAEGMDFILNTFGDRPQDGLDALISGSSYARDGARDSVEARQNARANHYVGGFVADIAALGHEKLLNSGALDNDIARALWSLDNSGAKFAGTPEALEIAKVMRKWQDKALDAANEAGAWIEKRSDYIVKQSHDRARIRKAGFGAWRDEILPKLDLGKTLDPDGPARRAVGAELAKKQERLAELEEIIRTTKAEKRKVVETLRKEIEDLREGVRPQGGMPRPTKAQREAANLDISVRQDRIAAALKEYKDWILEAHAERKALKPEARDFKKVFEAFRHGRGDVDDFLYHVWQGLSSGEHLKYGPSPDGRGGWQKTGIGSAAKKLSHERVLIFKDADGWMRYNERFGTGNLRESFIQGLERQARTTALMEVLGPSGSVNWEAMLDNLKKYYTKRRQEPQLQGLRDKERVLRNRIKEVDGSLNIAGDDVIAGWGAVARSVESTAKLGGVLISSFSDMPLFGSEFKYQGQGFFRPMLAGLGELVSGKPKAEKLAILSELGVAMDGMIGSLAGKFAGEELPGRMSRMMRGYFKLNLLTWWTDKWRSAAALMMSHGLAVRRAMGFDQLPTELSRVLGMYGIDRGKWDIIRQMDTRALDGKEFVTPEGVRGLPREVFDAYLSNLGIKSTDARVRKLRSELETQLRTYFRDRVDYAVLQPDSKTRATLRQGTSAGTVPGEALRFFAQFKAFPTSIYQKVYGRELFGRGANTDNFVKAMFAGNGELRGMARLFLMTTLFGYGSMTIKQLLQGKEPRPLNAENWHTTLAAAMLQGGALGVYGDFLFGEMRRSRGGSLAATIGGPVWSSLEAFQDIAGRMKEGDSFSASALRFALNHVPGNNLFYIRPVFDHAIGYEMFEMLSPGYMQRTIKRAKDEYGQRFWLRPGDASLSRLGGGS